MVFVRISEYSVRPVRFRVNTLFMAKTALDPKALRRHILVVEDEPLLRDLLAKRIEPLVLTSQQQKLPLSD